MENETLSKELETALKGFQAKNSRVPEGYFDQFEQDLMRQIHAKTSASKQGSILSLFNAQKKYLVAASLLFVVATGYLFYNTMDTSGKSEDTTVVQIETLPDVVVEAYVNSNELVAEVDWNNAIETTGASMTLNKN